MLKTFPRYFNALIIIDLQAIGTSILFMLSFMNPRTEKMKKTNVLSLLACLITTVLLMESCKKDEGCPPINCNTGTLNPVSCICDCPVGVLGTNCENFDPARVQFLLDEGLTPKILLAGGIPLDSLYGKTHLGGLIFYLNTSNGTGMVASTENQSSGAEWGCGGDDIQSLMNVGVCAGDCKQPEPEDTLEGARIGDGMANTTAILTECTIEGIAAKLCRDQGVDWFLPSRGELNLMYTNLHAKGAGGFADDFYWTSTESFGDNAWGLGFGQGEHEDFDKDSDVGFVRAARAF